MTDPTTLQSTRELAHRTNDGIEVTLLWSSLDDRLTVRVHDAKLAERFELEPARDRALEAFYHPYAYAATVTGGGFRG